MRKLIVLKDEILYRDAFDKHLKLCYKQDLVIDMFIHVLSKQLPALSKL